MAYDKPLSYSGLSLYKRCPRAWKHVYIDGNRSAPAKAAMRGTRLHEALEQYFNGGLWPESNETLRPWKAFMYDLATLFPTAEEQVAVTHDWEPTSFDDPAANLRGAFDLSHFHEGTLYVLDWKSGQQYSTHVDQANMYAVLGRAVHSNVREVSVSMVYLDTPKVINEWRYEPTKLDDLEAGIEDQVLIVRSDEEYLPTPSHSGCKWCDLSWRRGGSCDKSP